ncbi:serine/threonine protein kinase [Sandaracinus amylolyticus]|uniref:Serine/threonine protein kinase n=1 Tax=Sandaracinus amylolyticus TaxID=927083 RepID=A0A0F6SED0_9BACT|nr:serine/threonine protein kinase [Sandaracinus amylolyticus]
MAALDESIPARIGPYRVLARLAAGGMAEIYLAKRGGVAGFERAVVIKRMLPHLAHEPELRTTLLDEARLMSRLRHPNIVSVQEFSRDSRDFYLVMEYLRGESLSGIRRELLGRNERLDPALATLIISEMCAGLHAAHEVCDESGKPLHVVHRDVSPQNLFITFDGEVKLLDFGIACFEDRSAHTKTGMTKGKFAYMSPEQFAGEKLDRRADVFAAGAMLHELLTGKRLFARESEAQVLKAVLHDPIPLPSQVADDDVLIPDALDEICMKALARDREERFPSAEAMRDALRELMPQLDPRQRAHERLVELTRRVLPHRFAETEELMRCAARNSPSEELDAMTMTELSGLVSTDGAPRSGDIDVQVVLDGDRATSPQRPVRLYERSLRGWALAGSLVGLVLLGAFGFALLPRANAGTPTTAPPIAERAPAEPVRPSPPQEIAPPPPPSEPAPEPLSATVSIHIESTPSRAQVRIGRRVRGTTPLTIELPRGAEPVDVVVERLGHQPSELSIVPELDQRVVVRLRERATARPRPRFYQFD